MKVVSRSRGRSGWRQRCGKCAECQAFRESRATPCVKPLMTSRDREGTISKAGHGQNKTPRAPLWPDPSLCLCPRALCTTSFLPQVEGYNSRPSVLSSSPRGRGLPILCSKTPRASAPGVGEEHTVVIMGCNSVTGHHVFPQRERDLRVRFQGKTATVGKGRLPLTGRGLCPHNHCHAAIRAA